MKKDEVTKANMKPKKAEVVNSKTPVSKFIYCGPNIPGGILMQYSIFKGGIPKHLDGLISKCPAIKSLFVPVDKFNIMKNSIAKAGTKENLLFNEVKECVLKGGGK